MNNEWIKKHKPAAKRFMSIVMSTMVTFIITLSLIVVTVIGLAHLKKKRYGAMYVFTTTSNLYAICMS